MTKVTLSVEDIRHLAKLSNLSVPEDLVSKLQDQIGSVLEFVSKLQQVNTDQVDSTSEVTGLTNTFQSASVSECLSQTDVLGSAARTNNGYVVVKGVFEDQDA